ncbi:hypothetical protein [Macrococcus animalis]|uniref:hypothetical protein n=1 Tax=Macrococcus animalis TaxID=3395467 RepID=UPI0039BE1179
MQSIWSLGVKDGEIVKGGLNLLLDGTFDDFISPVPEQYARQIDKLDYVGVNQYKVKEGETLLTVEELDAERETIYDVQEPVVEEVKIIEPIQ